MVTADRGDTVLWGLALCIIKETSVFSKGLFRLLSGKEATCQCRVRFLDQKDSLEEEMATPSSIFAWSFPWTEEPGGLQSTELQRVGHD